MIKIEIAEVQNGFAFVKGSGAQKSAQIKWDGNSVTTANNNNGGFSFNGAGPAGCVGTLSDGVSTIEVVVLDSSPVSATLVPVTKTWQTTSYAARDDGALQKGVAWPNPRFTNNNNGTITDNLTGLTWLKDLNCLGQDTWANALAAANVLANGNVACGLADGSIAGGWRLPNRNELASLLDLGTSNPPLPPKHPFLNFGSGYWSSTTHAADSTQAWFVELSTGGISSNGKVGTAFVTAVRGGS